MLFSCCFYIIGIPNSSDYEQLSVFAIIYMTLQEALGNFGTVDGSSLTNPWLNIYFNILWLVMVVFMLIIYTNFLIASVSDTYEMVF
jgi:hypothetical protein